MHHHNSTQYCNTETVLLNIPFLQTNIMSDVAKWKWTGQPLQIQCIEVLLIWQAFNFAHRCPKRGMEQIIILITVIITHSYSAWCQISILWTKQYHQPIGAYICQMHSIFYIFKALHIIITLIIVLIIQQEVKVISQKAPHGGPFPG